MNTPAPAWAELVAMSNFSFLRGASHPEELVIQAKALGLEGLGIADRNTLAGIVRAHVAAKEHGLRLLVGSRLVPTDGPEIVCYPTDRAAYGRLSRLLSEGKMRSLKGECIFTLADVCVASQGQVLIVLPPDAEDDASQKTVLECLRVLRFLPGAHVYLALRMSFSGLQRHQLSFWASHAQALGVPILATQDVLYHEPARRPLQDVLTCVREHCCIFEAGWLLEPNAERHLRSPSEISRFFKALPNVLKVSLEILERCQFSLDELRYEYPDEPVPEGLTPQQYLETITWSGAQKRYPKGIPARVRSSLEDELVLIAELEYAAYFLTVYDIVDWARRQSILCQGRGSAANSAVCFCLGITSVDPESSKLLFARFLSRERREPPDIDVDFEHERREEVIQYIYGRYGRERAAIAATVICYRPRSAVRDVCKALGLSEDIAAALAGTVWGSWGKQINAAHIQGAGLESDNPLIRRALVLTQQLIGFPRHLSQHVGGFVLTRGPLVETVPIGNAAMAERSFIEWDKDDIDALGIMKVDVLALGMLSCIRGAFDLLRAHKGLRYELASLPVEDGATFDMICRADTIGVFQIESRAQMNMLPRLRPRCFYDLVIEVAIVRPGPIQGDMVHPYLRRRQGKETVRFPAPAPEHGTSDELEQILGRTLGVPLFQEQAMQIAIDAADFSPDEANGLRRAMATFRKVGTIPLYEAKMVEGMVKRGYELDFAKRCFEQIKGFGEYGFPESHAASFALLVYVSAWIKCHHPDVFCAALLNAQPMGFYAPAQIVRDARAHGVVVYPPDVNASDWHSTLEAHPTRSDGTLTVRLGLRQIEGLRQEDALRITAARGEGYRTVAELARRAGLTRATLERLASADAFGSFGLDRREALWAARGLSDEIVQGPDLLADLALGEPLGEQQVAPASGLPEMPLAEHVVQDYQTTRLSLKAHPMTFLRDRYQRKGMLSLAEVALAKDGRKLCVAGVVLVRQRPGSAKGVCFITLEDESGIANLVIWPKVMEQYRSVIMGARILQVEGRVQRAEGITHIVANQLFDRTDDLHFLREMFHDPSQDPLKHSLSPADEVIRPIPSGRAPNTGHPRSARIINIMGSVD
jgi:error-prone DNA polymerase